MLYEKVLRNKKYIKQTIAAIDELGLKPRPKVMEVCGTHTYAFFRFGLRKLLEPYVDFISGPGCPVCITDNIYIDRAIYLCKNKKNVIATFGDLLRVRGSSSSLEDQRAKGAEVLMVYSPGDALDFAQKNKRKKVIFLAIGFETTAPLIASTLKQAKEKKVDNFFVLPGNRLIPPAMNLLCQDREINIDGFVCPGHVSAVIGLSPYNKIVNKFKKGCVVAGFEPLDITLSLYIILKQIKDNKPAVVNTYNRVVKPKGNPVAKRAIKDVFSIADASWRGLGVIKNSGLFLNEQFKRFDATRFSGKITERVNLPTGCMCGEVIKGKLKPFQCPQFRGACSPSNPLGPCMVSFEGSCRIYYEYAKGG